MTEIKVPRWANRSPRRRSARWLKKPGDAVAVDEPLVELETDKVTLEVNGAGRRRARRDRRAKDGDNVAVGACLAQIGDGAAPRRRPRRSPPKRRRSRAAAPRRQPRSCSAQGAPAADDAAGAVGAQARRRDRLDAAAVPAPARTAASPRATCWRRSSAPRRADAGRAPAAAIQAARAVAAPTTPRARSACA